MKKYEVSFPYTVCYTYGGATEQNTATEIVDANNEAEAFQMARNLTEQKEIRLYKAHFLCMSDITTVTIKETSRAAINAELEGIFSDERFNLTNI